MNTLFAGAHDDRCVCRSRSERSASIGYHGGEMLENTWVIILSDSNYNHSSTGLLVVRRFSHQLGHLQVLGVDHNNQYSPRKVHRLATFTQRSVRDHGHRVSFLVFIDNESSINLFHAPVV
jgi:hypothetical protein